MKFNLYDLRRPLRLASRLVSLLVLLSVTMLIVRYAAPFATLASAEPKGEEESLVFVIDAGHGGEDPGAIGVNGVYEKDLNLEIAFLVGQELQARGYTVVFTRTEDRLLYTEEENIKGFRKLYDLKNRVRIANSYENAIFVSMHMNAFGQSQYSGLQTYYSKGNNDSRALAEAIQARVRSDIQKDNKRNVKAGKDIYLLENSENIAVLIECGFLSNELEAKKLSEKEYQKQLSFSIVCGIIEYIEKTNQS